ncbi:hypothetical protein [Polaribacter vadi]|uniref:hypothetical protein n=1 Tax=Polaribacter vadi TaxID=1774273 RepID=UPI0030ED8C01|tara:strand:+ start:2445 stop:3068 length:624 start_codon:yes stop_codon:yes gene_type:complete
MIDKFLKAKHWQLFLLTFGIPMIFQFIMMDSMISNIGTESKSELIMTSDYMNFFPRIVIIYMGVLFGWFWSISIGLQTKIPRNIKMKTKKFKIFFFIPLVYIFFISLFIGGVFSGIKLNGTEPSGGYVIGMIGIILPLHLLSMFGIFYSIYFVAKTLKTVELQKEVNFGDFASEFFMLWFYFIGIWIIQPKINKIAKYKNTITNIRI